MLLCCGCCCCLFLLFFAFIAVAVYCKNEVMTTFIEMAVYLNSNIAALNILVNFQGINHCDRAYFSNILEPFSMDVFSVVYKYCYF